MTSLMIFLHDLMIKMMLHMVIKALKLEFFKMLVPKNVVAKGGGLESLIWGKS